MNKMKTCRKCNQKKSLNSYYKHNQMLDGYLNFCIDCVKKRILKHRLKNLEKIRAYDRWRRKLKNLSPEQLKKKRLCGRIENMTLEQLEKKRERNKHKNLTLEQKEKKRIANNKWCKNNKKAVSAHNICAKKFKGIHTKKCE